MQKTIVVRLLYLQTVKTFFSEKIAIFRHLRLLYICNGNYYKLPQIFTTFEKRHKSHPQPFVSSHDPQQTSES